MKKLVKYFLIFVVLLFVLLFSAPYLFKNQIMELVRNTANQHLTANVDFKDVHLSLIKNFPDFTLDVYDFSITGRDEFEDITLVHVEDFRFTLNLMSVVRGDNIDIKTISLIRPYFHIVELDSLSVNYDIMVPAEVVEEQTDKESSTEGFSLSLRRFSVEDMAMKYDDYTSNMFVELEGLNHRLRGDFTMDEVDVKTFTTIDRLRFTLDGITMLSDVRAEADVDVLFNQPNTSINIAEGSYAKLNELMLNVFGDIAMPDEVIDMNVSFSTPSSELKPLISLIPAYYMSDFEGLDVSGDFDVKGKISGTYDEKREYYPSMDISMKAKNGRIRYPDLPSEVNNLMLNASVKHPGGDLDQLTFNLYQFSMNMAGQTFNGSFALATPLSDPSVSLNAKGKLNLDDLVNVVPLEEELDIRGMVDVDVKFSARLSDVENEEYNNIIAYGKGELTGFRMVDADFTHPIDIPHAYMVLTPQKVEVEDVKLVLGSTDVQATGQLGNLIHYAMSDAELVGSFNVASEKVNLDELMAFVQEEDPSKTDVVTTEDGEVEALTVEDIRLPKNIDFNLRANVNEVVFSDYDISDLSGVIHLKDQVVTMNETRMKLMGGGLEMDGSLNTREEKPIASFAMNLINIPFVEAYRSMDIVKQLAPIMERSEGTFSSKFRLTSALESDLSLDLSTLAAEGMLRTAGVVIQAQVFDKIAQVLKNDDYSSFSLGNTLAEFDIQDGRLFLKPFDFTGKQLSGNVTGSSGLDQTLDFDMALQLPFRSVKADKLLSQFGARTPSSIDLDVHIGGTYTSPSVKTSLADMGGNLIDKAKREVRDRVDGEIDDAKEKARERARDEADKIMKEARERADKVVAEAERQANTIRKNGQEAADKLRSEAKRQGDKLIREAGSNILKKRAAEEGARRLEREADSKAKRVENEANKRADDIVNKANSEADRIIENAQSNRDKLD